MLLGPTEGLLYAFYSSVALLRVFATLPEELGRGFYPFLGVTSLSLLFSLLNLLLEGEGYNLVTFTAVPDFGLFLLPLPNTDKEDLQPSWNS